MKRVARGRPPLSMIIGLALFSAHVACSPAPERIVSAAELERPSDAEVDEDPWRVLPPGAVAWLRTDASIWKSDFGGDLAKALARRLPLIEAAGVVVERDVELIIGAFYASVQNDVALVAQGNFSPEAFERAAASMGAQGEGPKALSEVEFAGETMYVKEGAAVALLTKKTLVLGTQLGVRRVLELVEERRMGRSVPPWFQSLLAQPGAHLQLGVDLDAQPVPSVLRTRLPALNHLRAARLVGNYKGGGLNLAGSLTFDTPAAAQKAEAQIAQADEQLERYRVVMHALDMPEPFVEMKGKSTGKDTQFAVGLEAAFVSFLLTRGDSFLQEFLVEE